MLHPHISFDIRRKEFEVDALFDLLQCIINEIYSIDSLFHSRLQSVMHDKDSGLGLAPQLEYTVKAMLWLNCFLMFYHGMTRFDVIDRYHWLRTGRIKIYQRICCILIKPTLCGCNDDLVENTICSWRRFWDCDLKCKYWKYYSVIIFVEMLYISANNYSFLINICSLLGFIYDCLLQQFYHSK